MHRCMSTFRDTSNEGFTSSAARQLAGGYRKFPHRLTFTRKDRSFLSSDAKQDVLRHLQGRLRAIAD